MTKDSTGNTEKSIINANSFEPDDDTMTNHTTEASAEVV